VPQSIGEMSWNFQEISHRLESGHPAKEILVDFEGNLSYVCDSVPHARADANEIHVLNSRRRWLHNYTVKSRM